MKNKENFKNIYSHKEVEEKWQSYWEREKIFNVNLEDFQRPKKYILSMFPYPSGSGLHVGHVRNYTIADTMARFYRMMGFNVFITTGWDAFGLPSEQYAIQTNNHPSTFTYQNIENFKRQLIKLGFSYDWNKEINTSESTYYTWTQWIFKQIYLEGLAEHKNVPVYWCEKLSTVLSNEEIKTVGHKKFSERGSFPVTKKNIPQWTLRITKYAHELLSGLDDLEWPLSIKNLQKNWIGISEGVSIKFEVVGKKNFSIEVFTTRPDTIYGVNAIALSPSSEFLWELVSIELKDRVTAFCDKWRNYETDYNKANKELFGEFTGSFCLNPLSRESIPIWVTNFAFADYGTGSLMIAAFNEYLLKNCEDKSFLSKKEVTQNYQIDYSFSKKFNLPLRDFAQINHESQNVTYTGPLLSGITNKRLAFEKVINLLEAKMLGRRSFSYHLKDWVFSRQRYWGEPIPIIHLENGGMEVLSDEELPLKLPSLIDFSTSPLYYSPLQKIAEWVNVKDKQGQSRGTRDVNVMPQWAGSCWYYIAFLLRTKEKEGEFTYRGLNDQISRKIINHWLPVDLYIGGQEHANLHLLYARFWHKILNKIGVVETNEPFKKLLCQGMVLGEKGEKMSKSKGNVINPDDCIEKWGSDALRLYEMFLGPPTQNARFNSNGVLVMRKWLNRVYSLFTTYKFKFVPEEGDNQLSNAFKKLVFDVTNSYESMKLNLIVAKLMDFINKCYLASTIPNSYGKAFLQLLNPLAPHITEEIWSFSEDSSITFSSWPTVSASKDAEEILNIIVQVDGKKRDIIAIHPEDNQKEKILEIIRKKERFFPYLRNKKIARVIFVRSRLISLITETII